MIWLPGEAKPRLIRRVEFDLGRELFWGSCKNVCDFYKEGKFMLFWTGAFHSKSLRFTIHSVWCSQCTLFERRMGRIGENWKEDKWWGEVGGWMAFMVKYWCGLLAPTQLSALFWHCCCSSRIGVAKEEEVRMKRMKRSEQILGDWMLTSSMFVAVLWLKSPDPSGQLPHRHILAISPLQRRFKYQICQEFDFQNLRFNIVNEYTKYKKIKHH